MNDYQETCRCHLFGNYTELCGLCEAKEKIIDNLLWRCRNIAASVNDLSFTTLGSRLDGWSLRDMRLLDEELSVITDCLEAAEHV